MALPYLPAAQSSQFDDPLMALYVPTVHSVQSGDPSGANFPGLHAKQGPPSGPTEPALQVQFDITTLPFSVNVSNGQSQQKELPVSLANVPAAHNEQDPNCPGIE